MPALVGHLEEQQVGQLLDVVAVVDAVVAEGVAEAPEFADDIGHAATSSLLSSSSSSVELAVEHAVGPSPAASVREHRHELEVVRLDGEVLRPGAGGCTPSTWPARRVRLRSG